MRYEEGGVVPLHPLPQHLAFADHTIPSSALKNGARERNRDGGGWTTMLSPSWIPMPPPLSSGLFRRRWCLKKPRFQAAALSPSIGVTTGRKYRRCRCWWCRSSPSSLLPCPFLPYLSYSGAQRSCRHYFRHCLPPFLSLTSPKTKLLVVLCSIQPPLLQPL
ncbi:hypothetical protein PIB30_101038 [Stylosanthes scabra]|uniref:Uncharacterized protein n=1 Tax=Stylosanthes scabra TaxID=79078 RepID=A0ABU6UWY8_9FABA|nr:hypothetical protein [Stylosanthes scabra]